MFYIVFDIGIKSNKFIFTCNNLGVYSTFFRQSVLYTETDVSYTVKDVETFVGNHRIRNLMKFDKFRNGLMCELITEII